MRCRIQVIYEDISDGERRCAFLSSCLCKTIEFVLVYQKIVIEKRKKPRYRNDNGASFSIVEVRSGRIWGFAVFDNGPLAAISAKMGLPKAPKV